MYLLGQMQSILLFVLNNIHSYMNYSSKHFDGQYSNEQILLKQHEHAGAFLLSHMSSFLSMLCLALIGM